MDEIDKEILRMLQSDAKMTNKEMAAKLNLSVTPVFERIKKLESRGYISSYSAHVDRNKVGLPLMVFCNISLERHQADLLVEFETDIQQFPEVIECHHVAGMFDYLLKVLATDIESFQSFISKQIASLNNIRKVQSFFVMSEVKSEKGIPIR